MLIGYEVSWDSCRGIRWIWVPPENGGMLSPSFDADKTGWFDGSQLVNPKKCNPNRHVSMLTVSAPPRPEDHGVRIHRPMDWVTETILRHLRPFFRNFDVSLLTIAHRLVTIADYDKVPGQRGIGRGQRSRRNCWDSWSTRHFIPSSISGGHRWSQSCVRLYMAIYIYIIYGYMMLYELSGRCRWRRSCCLKLVEWRSSIHRGAMVVFFPWSSSCGSCGSQTKFLTQRMLLNKTTWILHGYYIVWNSGIVGFEIDTAAATSTTKPVQ